jgi:hypothetical protein
MPVSVGAYVRRSSSDDSFGAPSPVSEALTDMADIPFPGGDPRFAPKRVVLDENGNLVVSYPKIEQPAVFSRRALRVAVSDLRAP